MCVTSPFTWGRSCHGQVRECLDRKHRRRPSTCVASPSATGRCTSPLSLSLSFSLFLCVSLLWFEVVLCEEDLRGLGRARLRPKEGGGEREKEKRKKSRGKKRKEKGKVDTNRGHWHRETVVPPFSSRGRRDYKGVERDRERGDGSDEKYEGS